MKITSKVDSSKMLIQCIECSGEISDKALRCPLCHKDPKGVVCLLCSGTLAFSKAYHLRGKILEIKDQPNHYHPDCLERFKRSHLSFEVVTCPECESCCDVRALWTQDQLLFGDLVKDSCSRCGYGPLLRPGYKLWDLGMSGSIWTAEYCSKCKLPIYRAVHGHCEQFLSSSYFCGSYHHPLCSPHGRDGYVLFYFHTYNVLEEQLGDFNPMVQLPPFAKRLPAPTHGCLTLLATGVLGLFGLLILMLGR